MYHHDRCPGEPKYKVRDGKTIKVCTGCTFPHRAENYDRIMEMIRK
jgi:Zn-finger protein